MQLSAFVVFHCLSHEGVVSNYDLSARLRIQKASLREGGGPLAVEGACENSPISIVKNLN